MVHGTNKEAVEQVEKTWNKGKGGKKGIINL